MKKRVLVVLLTGLSFILTNQKTIAQDICDYTYFGAECYVQSNTPHYDWETLYVDAQSGTLFYAITLSVYSSIGSASAKVGEDLGIYVTTDSPGGAYESGNVYIGTAAQEIEITTFTSEASADIYLSW